MRGGAEVGWRGGVARQVDAIMQEISVALPWRQGDVVLIDNFLTQHSRRPFVPPRRILAYLFQ